MKEIESSINRYLASLDAADRQMPAASEPDTARLEEKIENLKAQMKELQGIESQLNDSPDKQASLTDPDARSMMTRGSGIVGYNVQTAADTQHQSANSRYPSLCDFGLPQTSAGTEHLKLITQA